MPSDTNEAPASPEEHGTTADALTQIARLRAQVEALMRDRIGPAVSGAASRVESVAHEAGVAARAGSDELAGVVRQQPLTAVLIAAAMGFLLGRVSR